LDQLGQLLAEADHQLNERVPAPLATRQSNRSIHGATRLRYPALVQFLTWQEIAGAVAGILVHVHRSRLIRRFATGSHHDQCRPHESYRPLRTCRHRMFPYLSRVDRLPQCDVPLLRVLREVVQPAAECTDRKSTRLNSSHVKTSYAVFCLKNESNAGGAL